MSGAGGPAVRIGAIDGIRARNARLAQAGTLLRSEDIEGAIGFRGRKGMSPVAHP
jgi:hypothetical protein